MRPKRSFTPSKKEAEKFKKEFEVPNLKREANERITKFARKVKQKVKQQAQNIEVKQWEEKELHRRYPERLREADVDGYKTNQWLRSTGLKAETEGLIIAAQDQSLPTKSYFARIVKDGSSPLCRICHKYEETVDHIISGCPELAKTDYLERHNKAAAYMYIHWKACQHYNVKVPERWYEHMPKTVTENEEVTILWDMQIRTDKELSANKPEIVIKDHANRCCKLKDVSVPSDRNTSTKVIEKLSKYKDLEIETMRMWGMRKETVPVIVGALGLIREGMDQNLGKIPGTSNINELQKIILLGTAHILRRFLSIK